MPVPTTRYVTTNGWNEYVRHSYIRGSYFCVKWSSWIYISAWEYIQGFKDSVVETNKSWYQKTAIGAWEYMQGLSNSIAEANIGLELPMGDELESKKTFQSGNLTGNILTGFQAVAEVVVGTFTIGDSNAGTAVVGVGTGGLALPVILPANAVITVAAGGMITHGGFVWYNTIQNGRDTIQKFQSSSSSGGRVNKVKETNNVDKEVNVTSTGTDNAVKEASEAGKVKVEDIVFSEKFSKGKFKNQVAERGWTNEKITDAINNPVKVGESVNKATGNKVKLYFVDDVHYVAVDEGTGKVIQVADLNKANWVPEGGL